MIVHPFEEIPRKDHSLIFQADNIRAILDGRKTQTRRLMRIPPEVAFDPETESLDEGQSKYDVLKLSAYDWREWEAWSTLRAHGHVRIACPYGVTGDQLWVRESWRAEVRWNGYEPNAIPEGAPVFYQATPDPAVRSRFGRPRSPLHLPRWACRISLRLTDVRVQRLQDITDADARREGIRFNGDAERPRFQGAPPRGDVFPRLWSTAREAYFDLWDSLNAKRARVDENPWLWVLEFEWVRP
jgi:hypothetical protein